MKGLTEIRWHGRGGQGAKTAALLLADVCFSTGAEVQGFPEYGPERMGAPITAYNRISDKPIRVHSNIYDPDFVVVVDDAEAVPCENLLGDFSAPSVLLQFIDEVKRAIGRIVVNNYHLTRRVINERMQRIKASGQEP